MEIGGLAPRAVAGPGYVEMLCGSVAGAMSWFGTGLPIEGEWTGMAQRRAGTVEATSRLS